MFEYKATDRRALLVAARCCFRHAVSGWMLFVSSATTDLAKMLVDAAILFIMALYVGPEVEARYLTGSYASYVIVGFLVANLMNSLLKTFYNTVASGYWSSQFEFYGAFPRGISGYLLGSALFYLAMAVLRFVIVLTVGLLLFDLSLEWTSLGRSAALLVIGMLPAIGLGLAAASTFYLLDSRAWNDPISWAVHIGASLLAGVYFPPEILPWFVRALGHLLPHYHLLRALRLVALDGCALSHPEVVGAMWALLAMTAAFLPAGWLLFRASMAKAHRLGQFTRWT